jgi:hypothetical protein
LGKILFERNVGLVAAFLTAISCSSIFQAQQVRYFSLMELFSVVSFLKFVQFVQWRKPKDSLALAAINLLIVFTHPYGNTIPIAQFLFFLLSQKSCGKKGDLLLIILPVLIFLPVFFALGMNALEMTWWISKPDAYFFEELLATLSYGGSSYGLQDIVIAPSLIKDAYFLIPLMLGFFIWGMSSKEDCRGRKVGGWVGRTGIALCLLWFFTPVALAFSFSLFKPVLVIKHLLFVATPYYLVVSRGICAIRNLAFRVLTVAVIAVLCVPVLTVMYNNDFQHDWRGVARYLQTKIQNKNLAVVSTNMEMLPFFYYFNGPSFLKQLNIVADDEDQNVVSLQEPEVLLVGLKENRKKVAGYIEENFFETVSALGVKKWKPEGVWILSSTWGTASAIIFVKKYFREQSFKVVEEKLFAGIECTHLVKG